MDVGLLILLITGLLLLGIITTIVSGVLRGRGQNTPKISEEALRQAREKWDRD